MGVGKWIGFGGKVEAGETITAAALREFREETGVPIQPSHLSKIGLLLFSFAKKPRFFLEVHVYITFAVQDLPALCDEFCGRAVWFARDEIPFKVCVLSSIVLRFSYSKMCLAGLALCLLTVFVVPFCLFESAL